MAFWASDILFGNLIKGGWEAGKGGLRGVKGGTIGKTVKRDKETGLEYSVSPFRDGYLKDLGNNIKQTVTGKQYDRKGRATEDGDWFTNRLSGVAGITGNIIGLPLYGLGWTAGTMGKVAVGAGAWAAPKVARQVGRSTKEAIDLVGDTAINGVEAVLDLNKSATGQNLLFGLGGLGVVGAYGASGVFNDTGKEALKAGLAAKVGSPMESLVGTTAPSPYGVENMTADGDLVFAMHNMR